jgi:hypothetical protein
MTEPQVERRIAAIRAADMVAFRRLMEHDEEAGLDIGWAGRTSWTGCSKPPTSS